MNKRLNPSLPLALLLLAGLCIPTQAKEGLSLRVEGLTGSKTSSETHLTPLYFHEQADYRVDYALKGGIDLGLSLVKPLSDRLLLSLGFTWASRDLTGPVSLAIPHPLIFDYPRTWEGTGDFKATLPILDLALITRISAGRKIFIELSAGPALAMAKARILSGISTTEAYPFTDPEVSLLTEEVSKTLLGATVGFSAHFRLGGKTTLYLKTAYRLLKGTFTPTGKTCPPELKLGGLRGGLGLSFQL